MNQFNNKLLLAAAVALALGSSQTIADDKMAAKQQSGPLTNARQEAQIWTTYSLSPYLRSNDLSVSVEDGSRIRTGKLQPRAIFPGWRADSVDI